MRNSATTLGTSTFAVVCRIEKKIPIYRKYARNSGQSDFDLLADHTQAKIVIVLAMGLDLLGVKVMQLCNRLDAAQSSLLVVEISALVIPLHQTVKVWLV